MKAIHIDHFVKVRATTTIQPYLAHQLTNNKQLGPHRTYSKICAKLNPQIKR
jgi:hypothetical protein